MSEWVTPIDTVIEWMAKHGVRSDIQHRVRRLNPSGVAWNTKPRGYHPRFTLRRICRDRDLVSIRRFIKETGDLPHPSVLVKLGGKRRAVSRASTLDNATIANVERATARTAAHTAKRGSL